MKGHTKKNMRGFGLIEVMIVIGLVITLAIAAFVIYDRVQLNLGAKQTTDQLTKMRIDILTKMNRSMLYGYDRETF